MRDVQRSGTTDEERAVNRVTARITPRGCAVHRVRRELEDLVLERRGERAPAPLGEIGERAGQVDPRGRDGAREGLRGLGRLRRGDVVEIALGGRRGARNERARERAKDNRGLRSDHETPQRLSRPWHTQSLAGWMLKTAS